MDKNTFYDRIEKETGVLSTPTEEKEYVSLVSNGFPMQLYLEWKAHCKAIYNDIYWAKIWSDHLKAQAYDLLINSSVQRQEVPAEAEKKEEVIPMFGDGII